MGIEEIFKREELIFLLDKKSGKVIFDLKSLPKDHERLINSLGKMNFSVNQIEMEGWNHISSKYQIHPVDFSGLWTEKNLLLVDDDAVAITKTPEKLIEFSDHIKNTPVEDIYMNRYIEVSGVISPAGDEYDIKGDMDEEEIKIFNSIIHADDSLSSLIGEMLSLISGFIWSPLRGWFIKGDKHSVLSVFGKWVIIDSGKLSEILKER
ncbi:DUF2173 family protein [Persephonella atlantica]|uniref:DUF2173 family protein n=1 Tax=Persephonella atlantica TaxID=2699429 RepID=A0ABS1GF07_9AQUI|nr:DUF2173 family protein [Persephonella atlantica]MBK3331518.1 DUF2173 family protein [Persephonella atlantica]